MRIKILAILIGWWGAYSLCNAQDWTRAHDALYTENSYQAGFYLRQVATNRLSEAQRFHYNCLWLESSLLDRSPDWSVVHSLLTENKDLLAKGTALSRNDRLYYDYLQAWVLLVNGNGREALKALPQADNLPADLSGAIHYRRADIERTVVRDFKAARADAISAITAYQRDSARFHYKIYRSRLLLGLIEKELGHMTAAEGQYRLSLAILDVMPEPRYDERAKVLNNLGNLHRAEYLAAKPLYEESLRLRLNFIKDSAGIAVAYTNLGVFYYNFGDLDKAAQYYDQALKYSNKKKPGYLPLLINYAVFLNELYEFQESRRYLRSALTLALSENWPVDASWIRLNIRLAESELALDNMDDAAQYLQKARRELIRFSGKDPLWVEYYDVSALLESHRGDFARMRQTSDSAMIIFSELNFKDPVQQVNLIKRRADAARELEVYDEAADMYRQRDRLLLGFQSPRSPERVLNQLSLGEVAFRLGDLDAATDTLQQALTWCETIPGLGYTTERLMAHALLSRVMLEKYQKSKDTTQLNLGAAHATQAIGMVVRKKDALKLVQDQMHFSQNMSEVFPVALDIGYEQYSRGASRIVLSRIFDVMESGKAQLLLKTIRDQKVTRFADVTEAVRKQEEDMVSKEDILTRQFDNLLRKPNPEPAIYQSMVDAQRQLELNKVRFLDSLRRNLPDYYDLKYDQTKITLEQLQTWLRGQKGLGCLMFGHGRNVFYGMLITPENVYLRSLGSLEEIRALVRGYRNLARANHADELIRSGATLFRQLLSPFFDDFGKNAISKLAIIPDDVLVNLPFEALVLPESRKRPVFVVEQYEVIYNYSASLLWQRGSDSRSNSSSISFTGFAPSFSEPVTVLRTTADQARGADLTYDEFEFEDLPGARLEVESIKAAFDKKKLSNKVFVGEQATEQAFKRERTVGNTYIHLATHGFIRSPQTLQSGVAFSRSDDGLEDGLLLSGEVYDLRLNAELLTLSACDTGLGQYLGGEGVIGLSRAFMYAGARSILVSLWRVDDKATAELMTGFYRDGILKGLSKGMALRKAKSTMIKNGFSPYHWSSFIMIGAD